MKIGYCDPAAFTALLFLRREHLIGWRAFGLGMVIASFADKGTGEAWPSRATLSTITGIAETDISRVVRELANAGFLAIEFREGHSNIYRLTHGDLATGGKLPPSGKQPPTRGCLASKPVGVQPPITIKNNTRNNEYAQNDEKPPRRSAPTADCSNPNSESEPKGNSFPQGNTTPPQSPSPDSGGGKARPSVPKVIWDGQRLAVPDALRESWQEAYPCVDLDLATKRASAWCLSNPGKRPKKNFTKFLNGWLGRVKPSSPEYIDPRERAADDAELIRDADKAFPDPDERADFFYQRSLRGLRNPPGVECRPMPSEKGVAG